MSFKRILVPVDFSDYSEPAARVAVQLAADHGGELVLLHVVPTALSGFVAVEPVSFPPQVVAAMETGRIAKAKEQLAELKTKLAPLAADTRIDVDVRSGGSVDSIITHANQMNADLIVMGSQGIGADGRLLFGSVSTKVSRSASCPVLITSAETPTPGHNIFKRALVAIDYSDFSAPVAALARAIISEGGLLDFTHIWNAPFHSPLDRALGPYDDWQDTLEQLRGAQAKMLARFVDEQKLSGVKVERYVGVASPAKGLLDRIDATDPDLLVLGAHSRDSIIEKILGTVADRVLRRASVPVLLLPSGGVSRWS